MGDGRSVPTRRAQMKSPDQAGQRKRRIGVEIETGGLSALEVEESSAGDHRGVVRCQSPAGSINGSAKRRHARAHCVDERAITRDAATEDDAPTLKLLDGTRCFLDQRVDERILKRESEV